MALHQFRSWTLRCVKYNMIEKPDNQFECFFFQECPSLVSHVSASMPMDLIKWNPCSVISRVPLQASSWCVLYCLAKLQCMVSKSLFLYEFMVYYDIQYYTLSYHHSADVLALERTGLNEFLSPQFVYICMLLVNVWLPGLRSELLWYFVFAVVVLLNIDTDWCTYFVSLQPK